MMMMRGSSLILRSRAAATTGSSCLRLFNRTSSHSYNQLSRRSFLMATTTAWTTTTRSSDGISSTVYMPTATTATITNGASKAREIKQLCMTKIRGVSTTTTEKNEGNDNSNNEEDELLSLFQQMNATTRHLVAHLLPNDDDDQHHHHDVSGKMPDNEPKAAVAAVQQQQRQQQRRRQSRLALARAITLVESTAPRKRQQANLLLAYLLKYHTVQNDDCINTSFRVGITGAAGAGKSSMIEALGMHVLKKQKPNSGDKLSSNNNKKKKKASSSSVEKRDDVCGQEHSTDENDNNDDDDDDDVWYPNQLAVLCIDPSSHVSGGSILGDKTRMTGLSSYTTSSSVDDSAMNNMMNIGDRAFVRPSPSGAAAAMTAADSGGGIAGPATNDLVSILCPAAGYDWVVLETVGIGQSQTIISESVDLVVLLVPPGGGDGLQGIKKGIVEVADIIVVTKADGDLKVAARKTANDYKTAAHFLSPRRKQRRRLREGLFSDQEVASSSTTIAADAPPPPVLMVSAATGDGLDKLWKTISRFRKERMESGELEQQRRHQRQYWMWTNLRHLIQERVATNQSEEQKKLTRQLQEELDRGETPPRVAATRLLSSLLDHHGNNKNAHDGSGK